MAVAIPNYYVAHRALGYLYLTPVNTLKAKLDGTKKDSQDYINLKISHKSAVLKAIPHLEIAQACDPSDETLALIKTLYQSIDDTASISTLPERLAKLSKNCLDILDDTP